MDHWEAPVAPIKEDYADTTTSSAAIASLILGLLSLCGTFLTGIPAIVLGVIGLNKIRESHGQVKGHGVAIAGIITGSVGSLLGLCIIPVLLALLLPAVQAAREAARRAQCVNNEKQMALGLHNYSAVNGHFPPAAIRDQNGKPLLSWRVALLPFIEEGALYKEFKLDEPWDSPHNKALLARMPPTYRCPSEPSPPNGTSTTYRVFVGPGTLFEEGTAVDPAGAEAVRYRSAFTVVESTQAVPWTKPDELEYAPNGPIPPVGSKHPGGFDAAYADGSVQFIRSGTSALELREHIAPKSAGDRMAPAN
jgi:prepilin-type processing-associated H-X9-DG protein